MLDFERAPGADGVIGTADDVPLSEFDALTTQFEALGVKFSLIGGGFARVAVASLSQPQLILAFVGPGIFNGPAKSGLNSVTPGIGRFQSIQLDFTSAVNHVSLFELDLDNQPAGEGRPYLDLIAYDEDLSEITRDTLTTEGFPAGDGSVREMKVEASGIRRVVLDYANVGDNGVAFDDLTFVPEPVAVPPIDVSVDVKPGSCDNPLNVKAQGVLPVAVLGTTMFDVSLIDPASIRLAGVAALRSNIDYVANVESCSGRPDSMADLSLKFDNQLIAQALGATVDGELRALTLSGSLKPEFGGTAIQGTGRVRIIR